MYGKFHFAMLTCLEYSEVKQVREEELQSPVEWGLSPKIHGINERPLDERPGHVQPGQEKIQRGCSSSCGRKITIALSGPWGPMSENC